MATLSHPGIVEIYNYGQADGITYLVMQLVDGESPQSVIRMAGRLNPAPQTHRARLVRESKPLYASRMLWRGSSTGTLGKSWSGRVLER
jgi:serine/threonine protein kinase